MEDLKDTFINRSSSLGKITSINLEILSEYVEKLDMKRAILYVPHAFTPAFKQINLLLFLQYLLENNSVSSIYDPP